MPYRPARINPKGATKCLESFAKAIQALEAFLDIVHAGGVTQPDAVVGSECNSRYGGDFFFFQQTSTEFGGG